MANAAWEYATNTAKSAGQWISNKIPDSVKEGAKSIVKAGIDQQAVSGYSLAEIGKPFHFAQNVDPEDRAYKFLATRMNIVDIYPCNYAQSFLYGNSGGEQKSMFRYGLAYDTAMKTYRRMCMNYLGDANPPSALRIFLTDDTTVTDGIQTSYKENFFQSIADKLSSMAQGFTSVQQSISSSRWNNMVDEGLSKINTDGIAGSIAQGLGLERGGMAEDIMGGVLGGLKQGAAIVLKGNKLSLPKIWDNSTYHPNFSMSTKLFSPYGSPKAVKEYIIKPLVYILLMAVPHSDDMVSYNKPFAVTVRSWGTSFLSLAGITAVTLQRGGSDTVYNIYKQPLTVNVNIEFSTIVDGIFAFDSSNQKVTVPPYESQAFLASDQILPLNSQSQDIDGSVLPTVVPTLGGIIRSLQPVQFNGLTNEFSAEKSTREDTMIGGNGTSDLTSLLNTQGLLSTFNSAYSYATASALGQAGFGDTLLGGITSTVGAIADTATMVTNAVNTTLGTVAGLANTVTLGYFGETPLAKSISKVQDYAIGGTSALRNTAAYLGVAQQSLNMTGEAVGSLINFAVG